jgi:uncharacterized membrane protein
MTKTNAAHLWAVGFNEMGRADQVRQRIIELGDKKDLTLFDSAVAVRFFDGSLTLDGEPFVVASNPQGHNFASFLASLALIVPPLTSAAVGALERSTRAATAAAVGIGEDFVSEVEERIKPGTSALFVLDLAGDMDAILQEIRGLGGTVLKTSVDLERAKLIQATLAATTNDAKIDTLSRQRLDGKT